MTSDITKGNPVLFLHSRIIPQTDTIGGIILVDPPIVDVAQDERHEEFEVRVTNLAEVPLTPSLISAPYDVFQIDYSDGAIKPGESTEMKIRLMDGTRVQTAKKSFTFEFDDPKRTRFSLPVQLLKETRQAIQGDSPSGTSGGK